MQAKYSAQLVHKLGLAFPVLNDPGSSYLAKLGVMFTVPEALIKIYQGFGIDLERFNGDPRWQLPLPGRIIVDRQGVVQNAEFSTDHTERPEPQETLALLDQLS